MAQGRKKRKQGIVPSRSDGGVSERGSFDYDVQDFVIEILSWLPVKSLLRFRCVCKSWRALISNFYFVNKHLSHAVTTRLQILKSSPSFPHELYQTSLKVANRKLDLPTLSEVYSVGFGSIPGRMITIVGSCNGLICLQLSFGSFLLWNPSTRVTKLSPRVMTSFSCHSGLWDSDCTLFYRFGFDSSTQDYKVIVGKVSKIAVFAMKTGSWKIIQGLEHANLNLTGKLGCFSNGALHWLHIKQGKQQFEASCSRILSFDLATEEFQEVVPMPLPNFFKENKHRISAFDVGIGSTVRNSLFVYHKRRRRVDDDSDDNALTIWTINMECRSWTQVVKIPHKKFPEVANPIISILENDVVLMSYRSLVLYNPMKQKFFRFRHRTSLADLLQVTMCVETLVSPLTCISFAQYFHMI